MRNVSFKVYLILVILLALFVNRDILFNGYNYGRHWDWTFYPYPDFFRNYLTSFFYSLKPNSLTYFDVVSTPLSEVFLKGSIYALYQISHLLNLTQVTIPILNKLFVFVLIPILSSIGVWSLSARMLHKIREENEFTFFIITLFCNLLYTFSLILLLDVHGGALNRLISSFIIPWFYYFYYQYIIEKDSKNSNIQLYCLLLVSLFFDLANIFFFGILVCIAILMNRQDKKTKILHLTVFGIFSLLLNMYWLHPFLLNNVVNLQTILTERKVDQVPLDSYSSKYFEFFFPFNFPHNLLRRAYKDSLLIYLPYLSLFLLIFHNLNRTYSKIKDKHLLTISSLGLLTISILVTGFYSITQIQNVIYQIPILGFTKGAQRYVPVLVSFFIFFFLVVKSINVRSTRVEKYTYLLTSIICILFLCFNTPIVKTVVKNVIPKGYLNQDIGALYEYDASNYLQTKGDNDYYNILPVPSWFSPYFTHNKYPETSQGSNTESIFFGKGMLYTNGVSLFSSTFFDSFIKNPNPLIYGIANIKYILFSQEESQLSNRNQTFSYDWVLKSLPDNQFDLKKAHDTHSLYRVPDTYYYPQVYIPTRTILTSKGQKDLARIPTNNTQGSTIAIATSQLPQDVRQNIEATNKNNHSVDVDFNRISASQYRIRIKKTKEPFLLVLSTAFYDGWKLAPISMNQTDSKNHMNTTKKRIHGSLFNQSLKTNFASLLAQPIQESKHLAVNGFANAWYIDPHEICSQSSVCNNAPDGNWDLNFVAEFYPQRQYVIALAITASSVIVILYLIAKKKTENIRKP